MGRGLQTRVTGRPKHGRWDSQEPMQRCSGSQTLQDGGWRGAAACRSWGKLATASTESRGLQDAPFSSAALPPAQLSPSSNCQALLLLSLSGYPALAKPQCTPPCNSSSVFLSPQSCLLLVTAVLCALRGCCERAQLSSLALCSACSHPAHCVEDLTQHRPRRHQ